MDPFLSAKRHLHAALRSMLSPEIPTVIRPGPRFVMLSIDDNRPVAMIATKGPVIDTRRGQGLHSWTGTAAHHSKKRVVAHRHHEPRGECRSRASSQSKAEMMDEALQPGGSSRPGAEIGLVESLGEDASGALRRLATKAARQDLKMDGASRTWKVRDFPDIAAMDASRRQTARGARRRFCSAPHPQVDRVFDVRLANDDKTVRDQRHSPVSKAHLADSRAEKSTVNPETSSLLSGSMRWICGISFSGQ